MEAYREAMALSRAIPRPAPYGSETWAAKTLRSGVGLRLGANVGYLKFTDRPTWNPF
jgi:hypothetical protein